jgi:pyruvate/2-oxoglutarate dehydrogenase complex dihydrolipoamide dehydrogenase (E3) component
MGWDLIVLGGGAGGLAAAREAARLKARVLLVQDGPTGGDCTFTGCVPSKAVIEAANRGQSFDQAFESARRAIRTIAASEDDHALHAEGIEVRHGRATFVSPTEIDCDGARLASRRFVIATGSRPAVPPIDGLADTGYLTNETVFDLDRRPEHLVILGGGAVGCELAQAFARLGSRVTVIEAAGRLLSGEEPESSAAVAAALAADGVEVLTATRVVHVAARATGSIALTTAAGAAPDTAPGTTVGPDVGARPGATRGAATTPGAGVTPGAGAGPHAGVTLGADRLLVATGRRPAAGDLRLEAAGVAVAAGWIAHDDRLATNVAGIWVAGDVAGGLQLTHVADEMGRVAAHNAFARRPRRFDTRAVPRVVFTDPEVGRVGITEAEAGSDARVAYLPMTEVDRAILAGRTAGFVKLIAGPQPLVGHRGGGRLLGATVVAARGGEMVHEAALAVRTRMFAGRLAQTVHAYPSWSIALRQAAAQLVTEHGDRRARPARPDSQQ